MKAKYNKLLFYFNISNYITNRSTYLDNVSLKGPEHVLKRAMRSILIRIKNTGPRWASRLVVFKGWSWIAEDLVILQTYNLFLWMFDLYRYIGGLLIIDSRKTKLHTYTLTNALVNDNEKYSFKYKVICPLVIIISNISLHVIYKTREVFYYVLIPSFYRIIKDGRGFIVVNKWVNTINIQIVRNVCIKQGNSLLMKKAKYLNKKTSKNPMTLLFRSYSTNDNTNSKSESGRTLEENTKDFESIIKHWRNCLKTPNKVFSDLKGFLKRDSIWFAAFTKVMGNRGSKTVGPDNFSVNTFTRSKILEIKRQVIKGTWIWNGIKRINILKKKGNRPLVISSINDQLVQEVLKTIIEPIFELNFEDNSFGFRPNRSCHTALRYINTKMKDSIWIIKGDIKGYFDNIHHVTFMSIIRKRISDPIILRLINIGLKTKVFEGKYVFQNQRSAPQEGGILSPLLSNIYLHEFDIFMKQLGEKYQGTIFSIKKKLNPEYSRFKSNGQINLAQKKRITGYDSFKKEYWPVKYVRYADDFIVGINGSRKLACGIKQEIKDFLYQRLKLTLNDQKTKITHISKGVFFLGHIWSRNTYMIKQKYAGKLRNKRMQSSSLKVGTRWVIEALRDKKFCDGSGKPIPYFKNLRLPQSETNLLANTIIKGLCNWWLFAFNRRKITAYTAYIIRYSIAKMYAAKFRLGTVAKVFKIGTNDLSVSIGKTKKSAIGVADADYKKIQGILYDKYYKIPRKEEAFLSPTWKPAYLIALQKGNSFEIIKYLTETKKRYNPFLKF